MTTVVAIASQKGGTGKTTTTISLAAGLTHKGKRVLLIDMDSQANASKALLPHYQQLPKNETTYQTILEMQPLPIHQTPVSRLWIAPAHILLSDTDMRLTIAHDHREQRLKRALVSFDRIIGASARIYADHFPRFRQASSAIKSGETSVSLESELLVVAFSPKWEGSRHFMRYSRHFIWLKSKAACVAHSRYLSRAHAPGYLAETFPFSVSTEAKGGEIFVSESAKKQLRQVMSQSRFFRNQGCKRLQAHVRHSLLAEIRQ